MAESEERTARVVPITLTGTIQGYGVTIEVMATVDDLPALVARLRGVGVAPATAPGYTAERGGTQPAEPAAPPTCKYHGPMKPSKHRPGHWYCPAKMGDGSGYCKEQYPA